MIWLVFAAISIPLYFTIKSELAPLEDRGAIFGPMSAPKVPPWNTPPSTANKWKGLFEVFRTLALFHQPGNPTADPDFGGHSRHGPSANAAACRLPTKSGPRCAIPGINTFPLVPPLWRRAASRLNLCS